MSRARHHEKHGKHHKSSGGRTHEVVSGNPDVLKEAEERKHGGKAKKKHMGMHPEGKMAKHRHDRPMHMHKGRKAGGRVGADKMPLSSAHRGGKSGEMADGEPD